MDGLVHPYIFEHPPFANAQVAAIGYRSWWEIAFLLYKYICPEGAFDPHYVPYCAYAVDQIHIKSFESTFHLDAAPLISDVIRAFHAMLIADYGIPLGVSSTPMHAYGPWSQGLGFRGVQILPSVGRRASRPASLSPYSILLHTPRDLRTAAHGLRDPFRSNVFEKFYPAWEIPRITIVPRLPDCVTFIPRCALSTSLQVGSSFVHACSLAAKMSLTYPINLQLLGGAHQDSLSFLMWDIGTFRPEQFDIGGGFAAQTRPPLTESECKLLEDPDLRDMDPENQYEPWGSMLLLRPCYDRAHLLCIINALGYAHPIVVPGVGITNPEHDLLTYLDTDFDHAVERLKFTVGTLLGFHRFDWSLSPTGIRVLDVTDRPNDLPAPPGVHVRSYWRPPHPLGVEITLPRGAPIPSRIRTGHGNPDTNEQEAEYIDLPPAVSDTTGTGTAWLAHVVERKLREQKFITLHRSYHMDNDSFRIRLYLLHIYWEARRGPSNLSMPHSCVDFIMRIIRRYHEQQDRIHYFDAHIVGLRDHARDHDLTHYRPYLFPHNSRCIDMSDADRADMHERQIASAQREAAHVLLHGPSSPVPWDL